MPLYKTMRAYIWEIIGQSAYHMWKGEDWVYVWELSEPADQIADRQWD